MKKFLKNTWMVICRIYQIIPCFRMVVFLFIATWLKPQPSSCKIKIVSCITFLRLGLLKLLKWHLFFYTQRKGRSLVGPGLSPATSYVQRQSLCSNCPANVWVSVKRVVDVIERSFSFSRCAIKDWFLRAEVFIENTWGFYDVLGLRKKILIFGGFA